MDLVLVGQFWAIAALLACTPGADWAFAIAAGIRARSVIPALSGIVVGYIGLVGVVAVGLGVLVTSYPIVLTVLTVAGAAYLLVLGISTLASAPAAVAASDGPLGDGVAAQFLRGACVSGINPKGVLLLVALLPQFVSPAGWPSPVQMLVLGGLHVCNCVVVYGAVALLARRVLAARPRVSLVVTRVSGVVMTLIGVGLLAEQVLTLR